MPARGDDQREVRNGHHLHQEEIFVTKNQDLIELQRRIHEERCDHPQRKQVRHVEHFAILRGILAYGLNFGLLQHGSLQGVASFAEDRKRNDLGRDSELFFPPQERVPVRLQLFREWQLKKWI